MDYVNAGNLALKQSLIEGDAGLKKYDMNNPFLTDDQKVITEAWYQLPIGVFSFTFFILFIFSKNLTVSEIVLLSYLIGIIIAIINWSFLSRTFISLGYIFGGTVSSIISITFAIYFGIEHHWILMALAIATSIGLLGFLSPSIWLYSFFTAKRGFIHPKYVFADRYFEISK